MKLLSSQQAVWFSTWLLRLMGASIGLALFPIFMPLSWMAAIHEWLGMGAIPDQPIFEYMARTLSGMYFAHGCVIMIVSTNVTRFLPLVWLIAGLNLFLGGTFWVTDILAGMPTFWTYLEGPPIMMVGMLLLWLVNQIEAASEGTSQT